jgi:CRP/FNR family transcriptional regulator
VENSNSLEWINTFPSLLTLEPFAKDLLSANSRIAEAPKGTIGYRVGSPCKAFVMRLQGSSRVYRISENGREILLYKVGPGETCVLTTTCLLGHNNYPAETTVEEDVRDVIIPAAVFHRLMQESQIFRKFVMENYGALITNLIVLLDDVAFQKLESRIANLLINSDEDFIYKTHDHIAGELGTVRVVVSRQLKKFEMEGWIKLGRGRIQLINRPALHRLIDSRTKLLQAPS